MAREIRLNAFITNAPVHLSPGMWRHPRDRAAGHARLPFWLDLARLLERGLFDALFIADAIGVSNVYGGSQDMSVRYGLRVPRHDPFVVVPAMAAVTEHLGFGVTGTLSYEPPFLFARRMSTLDHLTDGRVGWNIVTGHLAAGAKAMGQTGMTGHDKRYDIADEYMEVVYKLWEGSWEDGAVLRDKASGIFTDASKVHPVHHLGETYRLDSIHMVEPSPQRTPVLFQAGASARGREFAAAHAECVFVSSIDKETLVPVMADLRARAVAHGRGSRDVLCLALMTCIVGRTDAEAREKLAEYQRFINPEAALASMSGFTGIDLSHYAMDDPFPDVKQDSGVHSIVDSLSRAMGGQAVDHSRGGGAGLNRRIGADDRGITNDRRGRAAGLDGDRRSRRLQPELRDLPRRSGGFHRHGGAGAAGARCLQGLLCAWDAARQAHRHRPDTHRGAPGGAPPAIAGYCLRRSLYFASAS